VMNKESAAKKHDVLHSAKPGRCPCSSGWASKPVCGGNHSRPASRPTSSATNVMAGVSPAFRVLSSSFLRCDACICCA
jgi:hypothetical protein